VILVHKTFVAYIAMVCVALAGMVLAFPVMAKEVVGWVEKVHVFPGNLIVKAKIDSGAKTSSLHCDCIKPFERNGEKWVRFSITNYDGKTVSYERKIVRTVKIKRHFGNVQQRFVISLGLCLAGVYKETDVSLVDRSGLNYQLLVGRRFLEGTHLIDSGNTYITKSSSCKGKGV